MKNLFIKGLFFFISISLWATAETVKVCDTTISFEGKVQQFVMKVNSNVNSQFSGEIQVTDIEVIRYEKVEKATYQVREGLSSNILDTNRIDDLNKGEQFVVHAMAIEKLMSSGIDLKAIHIIDIYKFIEENVNIGITAFAEASDIEGKIMGSFMGGFFVSPCK